MFKEAADVQIVIPKIRSCRSFISFHLVKKKVFGAYTEQREEHVIKSWGADVTA